MPIEKQEQGSVVFSPRILAEYEMFSRGKEKVCPVTIEIRDVRQIDTYLTISFDDGYLQFRFRSKGNSFKETYFNAPGIRQKVMTLDSDLTSAYAGHIFKQFSLRPVTVSFIRSDLVSIIGEHAQVYVFEPGTLASISENIVGDTITYAIPGVSLGNLPPGKVISLEGLRI